MRTSKISWGIILVFVGTVFLLENYGVIDFHWTYVWKFWPVILVIMGLNIIFNRSESPVGKWLVIFATVCSLGLITYVSVNKPNRYHQSWDYFDDEDDVVADQSDKWSESFYSEDYDARFKTATLNINGGASKFAISSSDKNLFESSTQKNNNRYYLRKTDTDSSVVLNFNAKSERKGFNFKDTDFSKVAMKIHPAPLWDINLNMGAGKADFDFSKNRVQHINLKGGAAEFKVKIGALYNDVNLAAETGIAKVTILIPRKSGCKINTDTGLSSTEFDGFSKSADGSYLSNNYSSSENKINIYLKGGLSDFKVRHY